MAVKLSQITDSIHGTIYLSKLEAELTSTPYIYRLHDIYQSSTVYMTFPSNRTKRYEHSLGTMELASSMFFSSISNANSPAKDVFFSALRVFFRKIFGKIIYESEKITVPYYTSIRTELAKIFRPITNCKDTLDKEKLINKTVEEYIKGAIKSDCFHDSALDYFQLYQIGSAALELNTDAENYFLYRCMLQAIRVVSLFHDVGHPPYSHVIETELVRLYRSICANEDETLNSNKVEGFKRILKPYATQEESESYKCQTICFCDSAKSVQLHERIGLSLLQSAMNEVVPKLINGITQSNESEQSNITHALYYITVTELAIATMVDGDWFFKSMHRIVDGVVDADRLDYIMRDSVNSGVDWGAIPYKRLINSCKLVCVENKTDKLNSITSASVQDQPHQSLAIAFPLKLSDDIVDLLTIRYKIFVRINFHHRCIKTAVALQSAVREIVEDYLKAKDGVPSIGDEISFLWNALDLGLGVRATKIIQWNDSGLITVLHHALVKLSENEDVSRKTLCENLEEILMNKKRYHALIKRGNDSKRIVDKIFKHMGLTTSKLEKIKDKEQEQYYRCHGITSEKEILADAGRNALEALKRIRRLQELLETGDLEILEGMLPASGEQQTSLSDIMRSTLKKFQNNGKIEDYKVITNEARKSTGLPKHSNSLDEIYLYFADEVFPMDECRILRPQIETLEKNSPWIFAYYVPGNNTTDADQLEDEIYEQMAIDIGDNLKQRFMELFDHAA